MRLLSIQYLRGIAALLIVFFHAFVQLDRFGFTGETPQVLNAGVDIFFVISGFIMWYTTVEEDVDQVTFIKHRVRRIVPLYWIVTTFYLLVLLSHPAWMQSGKFNLYHVIASYLFIPAPHPANPLMMWPLVVPGWSLNCEMFFYLLFSFGLSLSFRPRFIAIESAIVGLVVIHYVFDLPENSVVGFYTSNVMLEFAFGIALGYAYSRFRPIGTQSALAILLAGTVAFGLVAVAYDDLPATRCVIFGVPALLVVAGAALFERSRPIPRIRIPELIGNSSYSLYLIHGAVLSLLAQVWRHLFPTDTFSLLSISTFMIIGVLSSAIVGIGIYVMVERPLLRALSLNKAVSKSKVAIP